MTAGRKGAAPLFRSTLPKTEYGPFSVGVRVKSGYAIAVVLAGSREAPRAVARRVVELSDPDVAETRQPYHDGFYKTEEDPRELARRLKIVERCTKQAVGALVGEVRGAMLESGRSASAERRRAIRAALVVGSVIDPTTVGNPHIRAHAHEGRLFRTVLEEALQAHDIDCDVIVEKQLSARAVKELGRPPSAVTRTVAALGKTLNGPWRADEKAAATAAWLALSRT